MRAGDLIEGERYILKNGKTVVYLHKITDKETITLADGSELLLNSSVLKFLTTDEPPATILVESGSDVEEPVSTKLAREQKAAEKKAAQEAALLNARQRAAKALGLGDLARVGTIGYGEGQLRNYGDVLAKNAIAVREDGYQPNEPGSYDTGWTVLLPLTLLESLTDGTGE